MLLSLTGQGKTVLVTGGSGFVAGHVLNSFLNAGYHVRATVRSEASIKPVISNHLNHSAMLSFAMVPDIEAADAFDEAVAGVDGVVHTASPFVWEVKDYEKDMLNSAMKGTVNILECTQRVNPAVKRVVITSSSASIVDINKELWPEHTYSEADWNPVFAEKAAFELIKERLPNFTIATICPPMIYGPAAHAVKSLDKLNTWSADIYRFINGSESEVPDTGFPVWADARDVTEAHLRAYESPEAAGQRCLLTGGKFTYVDVCRIIREQFPEKKELVPNPDTAAKQPESYGVDTSEAQKELGIKFRSLETSIHDTVANLIALEKKFAQGNQALQRGR